MTREEALNQYRYYNSEWYKFTFEDLLNDIYDDFEQRIAELEAPKTCDGCEYQNCKNNTLIDIYCKNCNRNYVDYYEPKESL